MKKLSSKSNVLNKVKSVGVNTSQVTDVIPSNLLPTHLAVEEVVEEVVEESKVEAKKPPKISAKVRELMVLEAEAMEDEDARKMALDFLKLLEEKEIVSDGTTRASQSADTDKMKKFRTDFITLCSDACDGKEINSRGGTKYYFTDADGKKRVIRIYMKTEKELDAETETAVKLVHDEPIEVDKVDKVEA